MKKIPLIILLFFMHVGSVTPNKVTETFEDPVQSFIELWDKTPYRYGGSTIRGVDCSGFVMNLYNTVYQKKLPRSAYHQYRFSKKIKKKDLIKGDLVFFRTGGRRPWHVGFYLGDNKFVHSVTRRGVTIDDLSDDIYRSIFFSAGRVII